MTRRPSPSSCGSASPPTRVFGGADFGAGFWDLVAGGAERGRAAARADRPLDRAGLGGQPRLVDLHPRRAVDRVPAAFAAIMSTLFVPLALAALGIVLRGAGFAFRKSVGRARRPARASAPPSRSPRCSPRSSWAPSSARSPRAGSRPAASGDPLTSWLNPTSILGRACCSSPSAPTWPPSTWSATRAAPATTTLEALLPAARALGAARRRGRRGGRRHLRAARRRPLHLRRPHGAGAAAGDRLRALRRRRARAARARGAIRRAAARRRGRRGRGLGLGRGPVPVPAADVAEDRPRRRAACDAGRARRVLVFAVAIILPALGLLYTLHQRSALDEHAPSAGKAPG